MTGSKEFAGLGPTLDAIQLQQIPRDNIPPSSLAITSALSSIVVYAIELFEFPNEIPIACRSLGVVPLADAPSAVILLVFGMRCGILEDGVVRKRCFLGLKFLDLELFFCPQNREFSIGLARTWAPLFRKAERTSCKSQREQTIPVFNTA
jgi:hypothetical protein